MTGFSGEVSPAVAIGGGCSSWRCCRRVAGVNNATLNAPAVPFGGIKHSGLGREGGRDAFLTWHTAAVGT
jgi:hypothetical protein